MRTTISATTLLLAAGALVPLTAAPASAASTCPEATTTWVGPTGGGSNAWDVDSNWSDGVPTADSIVCIQDADPATAPHVPEGSTAEAEEVVLPGLVSVAGTLTLGTLTTNEGTLTGGGQVVSARDADLGGVTVTGGTTLTLQGDNSVGDESVLNGDVETLDGPDGPGLLEIPHGADLVVEDESVSARIRGPLRNSGAIVVTQGNLDVLGTGTGLAEDGLSTGAFVALSPEETGAEIWLDGVNFGDGAFVARATMTSTTLAEGVDMFVGETTISTVDAQVPALAGAGSVELYENSRVDGPSAGSVQLVLPEGETASVGAATLSDTVRLDVEGELVQPESSSLVLEDSATVHVSGVHRIADSGSNDELPSDFGTEFIEPGGRLESTGTGSELDSALINHGTVEADGAGLFVMGELPPTAQPSTGAFVADGGGRIFLPGGTLGDGSSLAGDVRAFGPLELDGTQVDGPLTSLVETWADGSVHVTDATLGDGGSISGEGELVVDGVLRADPGVGGTASVSGAQVLGTLRAESGTLDATDLDVASFHDDILDGGLYVAADGTTLELPAVRDSRADLVLGGPTASFGTTLDGLETVTAPGSLDLRKGADLATDGDFANLGHVLLSAGSRFAGGGDYRQGAAATFVTSVRPNGRGMLTAQGRRQLRGTLEIRRVADHRPTVGRTFLVVKAGQPGRSKFTGLVWTSFGNRSFEAEYADDGRVWLRVVKGG